MLIRHSRMFVTQHLYLALLLTVALVGAIVLIGITVAMQETTSSSTGSVPHVIAPVESGLSVSDRAHRGLEYGVLVRETGVEGDPASAPAPVNWGAGVGFDPGVVTISPGPRTWGMNVGLDAGYPVSDSTPAQVGNPYDGSGIGPTMH